MYKSILTKERIRFSRTIMCVVMLIFTVSSCTLTTQTPQPPVEPILYAVLVPGSPPTFARKTGQDYEVLPSSSVILRFTNSFPGPSAIKIVLSLWRGSAVQLGPLQYVQFDNIAQQRALDSTGYFMVVVDAYGYSVFVVPPPQWRRSSAFLITLSHTTSNGESNPLEVGINSIAPRTKPSDVFFDCGDDFDSIVGKWHYNCKEGASIVLRNFTLEGWLVGSFEPKDANCRDDKDKKLCIEDFYYDIIPNSDFIDAFYGPNGMFSAIHSGDPFPGIKFPGDPAQPPSGQLSFQDIALSTGSSKGININSFILPRNPPNANDMISMHIELNAWHVNDQGCTFCRHWKGRGPAPAGWIQNILPTEEPMFGEWSNTRWPYIPQNPDGGARNLLAGDYVRINGTLWQDASHEGSGPIEPWEAVFPGHGGWLEIHPPDWIERVLPAPTLRKTPILVQYVSAPGSPSQQDFSFKPEMSSQSGEVLRCRELIDGRFTNMGITRTIKITPQEVNVSLSISAPDGRFKAVYLVWWEQGSTPDTTCS